MSCAAWPGAGDRKLCNQETMLLFAAWSNLSWRPSLDGYGKAFGAHLARVASGKTGLERGGYVSRNEMRKSAENRTQYRCAKWNKTLLDE